MDHLDSSKTGHKSSKKTTFWDHFRLVQNWTQYHDFATSFVQLLDWSKTGCKITWKTQLFGTTSDWSQIVMFFMWFCGQFWTSLKSGPKKLCFSCDFASSFVPWLKTCQIHMFFTCINLSEKVQFATRGKVDLFFWDGVF